MSKMRCGLKVLCGWALWAGLVACAPAEIEGDAKDNGKVTAEVQGGQVMFRLEGLQRPLRTLQVTVAIEGTRASSVTAAAGKPYNIVEAGLGDGPVSSFRLVVGDTRRLLLTEGDIALLGLEGSGTLTLAEAIAVSDEGERLVLQTEVR